MAGISSKAVGGLINKKKYNGIEENRDLDLNQYDAFYRTLDPQTGRFWQVDPQVEALESYSPYESMGNNPISNVDPLGDFKTRFGAWWHSLWNGGGDVRKNNLGEWYVRKTETSDSKDGGPTVTAHLYYGRGRDKYSTARETLLRDYAIMDDIRQNGENSMYQMYDSPEEAGTAALSYTGLLFPNAYIKPATIAINAPKLQQVQKVIQKIKITFGNNSNQVYHAFRHTDEMGLSRSAVQSAIQEHLPTVASQIVEGKPLNQVIEVAGQKIQYSAYKLPDGSINVGRIHAAN